MTTLTVSGSPHIQSGKNANHLMWQVVLSMVPAIGLSFYFFGIQAVNLILVSVVACVAFEYLIQRLLLKGSRSIQDGSAVITGILLAFNVPSNLPLGILIIGALVSIGIAKMSFGGLGKNPFNPALVGRVFLLISFPVQMTAWPKPGGPWFSFTDAITSPTPLGTIKEGLAKGNSISQLMADVPGYWQMFSGFSGGSLGEVSAMALLIGGLYLLARKIITWHIPVTYLLSAFLFSGILWYFNPQTTIDPAYHLLSGGLMLGAWYMATDMVTSPMSAKGMIIFGAGCGVITIIIRVFGAYPEGVSFAILIMNAFVPLINIYCKPKRFGQKSSI